VSTCVSVCHLRHTHLSDYRLQDAQSPWQQPTRGKALYVPQFQPSSSSSIIGQLTTDIMHTIDPSDDEFREAFAQYGREKNGSGLSAVEQLARLNVEFPRLNIQCVFYPICVLLLLVVGCTSR
jgi:hypothetical protein